MEFLCVFSMGYIDRGGGLLLPRRGYYQREALFSISFSSMRVRAFLPLRTFVPVRVDGDFLPIWSIGGNPCPPFFCPRDGFFFLFWWVFFFGWFCWFLVVFSGKVFVGPV